VSTAAHRCPTAAGEGLKVTPEAARGFREASAANALRLGHRVEHVTSPPASRLSESVQPASHEFHEKRPGILSDALESGPAHPSMPSKSEPETDVVRTPRSAVLCSI